MTRWAIIGLRGIRLESQMVGGKRHTTRAALDRFCEKLTEARESSRKRTGQADADPFHARAVLAGRTRREAAKACRAASEELVSDGA
jgi:hypothetical protein